MKQSHSHFDEIADLYDESLPSHVVEHYLLKRTSLLQSKGIAPPEDSPILEVGAGTGTLARRLSEFTDLTAIDYSFSMLKKAAWNKKAQASAAALPFKSNTFHLVYSVATMHHIVDPGAFESSIAEMVRVTAVGGRIVIWDHNPLNPYWPLLMARVPQDQEPTKLRLAKTFLRELVRNGAEIRSVYRSGWIPDFCPAFLIPYFAKMESFLEKTLLIRHFSAHNVILAVKQ